MHGPASPTQYAFLALILLSLLPAGFYLCVRLARMLRHNFPAMPGMPAHAVTATLALLMMLHFAAWGFFIYLTLALAAGDALGLVARRFQRAQNTWQKFWRGGATGLAVAVAICAYGYFNAKNIRATHYEITIPKAAGNVEKFRAVLITDLHIGTIIREPQLDALAGRVNALAPDIVILGGDIYDHTPPGLVEHSLAAWQGMDARHGVVFIGGNHERARYAGPHIAAVFQQLEDAGVRVLEDEHLLLDGAIYVVGRKDRSIERLGVAELTRGLDKTKPVILLDHQPVGMAEAAAAGVDLKLSGHTHAGQIWPFGLAVRHISENELVYGLARFGNMQAIVSSGAGTWRIPARVGTHSEIVVIDIAFSGDSHACPGP